MKQNEHKIYAQFYIIIKYKSKPVKLLQKRVNNTQFPLLLKLPKIYVCK